MINCAFAVTFHSFCFTFVSHFSGWSGDAELSFFVLLTHVSVVETLSSIFAWPPDFFIWGIKVIKLSLNQLLTLHKLLFKLLNIIGKMLIRLSKFGISNYFNLKFIMIFFHKSIVFIFKLINFSLIFLYVLVINLLNNMQLGLEILFHFLYFNSHLRVLIRIKLNITFNFLAFLGLSCHMRCSRCNFLPFFFFFLFFSF